MKVTNLIAWLTAGTITAGALFGLTGCNKETPLEDLVQVKKSAITATNGKAFDFRGSTATEISSDTDNVATYGVISDIHGEVDKVKYFVEKFQKRGVDGIIVPGDLVNNERFSGRGKKWDDGEETIAVLTALGESGLPVFVIPGNHDTMVGYRKGLSMLGQRFSNIIDMSTYQVVNGEDVDFVSLPGYTNRPFTAPGALFMHPVDITKTGKLSEELDDTVVLIAHGAGYTNTNGKLGPATVYSGQDVGDKNTTKMMKANGINFAVVGNIHEAGGLATTHDGTLVRQGEWAEQFTANFGGLEKWKHLGGRTYDGMAGILTVEGKKAKFDMLYFK